jgi:hypothetical protein
VKCFVSAATLLLLVACTNESTTTTATTPPEAATTTTAATATQSPAAPVAPTCTPAANRLCPVDDGATDPSFAAYREQLRTAVKQKDEAKLLELVDPNIRTSFGGGGGTAEFQALLRHPDAPIWPVLEKVLSLGGSFQGEGDQRPFWAPYVYANWPESIDAFQHVVAIAPGVVLRASPNPDAGRMTTVDWAILELLPADSPSTTQGWLHVKTPDSLEGWVRTADVHSPVGYRAGFNKTNGQWKMTAFVAGD